MKLREELAERMGEVRWSDLRAHAARDAVILVAADVDLLEVAVAVARDQRDRVAAWIDGGKLGKPTEGDLVRWEARFDARFVSVIVAPFVLVRELADPARTN